MAQPNGILRGIYTAPDKGIEMASWDEIMAIAGAGLEGDRYALDKGAWSHTKIRKVRHVSLIAREAVRAANQELDQPFRDVSRLEFLTRRNLLTEGIDPSDLNEFVGETFTIGSVLMRGVELCDPCKRPERLAAEAAGFEAAFQDRGGIRAEVLEGGPIRVGDPIQLVP